MRGSGLETVLSAITQTGLVPRGAFLLSDEDRRGALASVRAIVLAGMAGRDGWSAFVASPEAADGADHPLDRWSRRVIEGLARDLGALALFPFGGPPFWPFQQWARRSEPVHPSPIGLLIHPRYGLWHSYRGALGFREALDVPELAAAPSPCELLPRTLVLEYMPRRRVLSAAATMSPPAPAIWRARAGEDCMDAGCRARRACPVGAAHAYGPDQASFTMRAFLRARRRADAPSAPSSSLALRS